MTFLTGCSGQQEDSDLFTSDSLGSEVITLALGELPNINQENQNDYTISGQCNGSDTVSLSINSDEISFDLNCENDSFSKNLDLSTISESSQVFIEVQQLEEVDSVNVLKDSTIAQINSITIADGTYAVGDTISIIIDFTERINIVNEPRLSLLFDSQSQSNLYAEYSSGSGTSTLVFTYIVSSGDGDNDGIILNSSFDLSTGDLEDLGGNSINNLHVDTNYTNVLIDSSSPVITSFVEPANGTYSDSNGELLFQVNFSETIVVSGTPRLSLLIGTQTVHATYKTGSGTSGLEFSYTILAGDDDGDGVELNSTSIDLNGGSIKASSDADNSALTFAPYLDSMSAVLVDTSSGITPPDQVTGVTTAPTTDSSSLAITWAVPSDNGTSILNYTVQYREQGSSTWLNVSP